MLTSDFLRMCAANDPQEFRDYLEYEGPDGEKIIDHMARTGISLENEREAYYTVKRMQERHAQRKLAR